MLVSLIRVFRAVAIMSDMEVEMGEEATADTDHASGSSIVSTL